jgi:F-type H+-transporting ATPase subunit epsilon
VSERTLLCEIVTPERIVYTSEARMVVAPTIDGEIGILPLHAPLVSALNPGEIRVRYSDDEVEWFAVSGGYIQVHEDKVIILADHAAASSQIDVDKARQALELAQRRLGEVAEDDAAARDACEIDLKWCETQLEVARRAQ